MQEPTERRASPAAAGKIADRAVEAGLAGPAPRRAGRTAATQGNLNNHWGLPLSLARLPRDTEFGVFEIGMNHPGEITPLSQILKPDAAIVTNVEAVHLAHFGTVTLVDGVEQPGD